MQKSVIELLEVKNKLDYFETGLAKALGKSKAEVTEMTIGDLKALVDELIVVCQTIGKVSHA